jgi:hypothetical protein
MNFGLLLKKYSVPALFLILGILLLIVSFSTIQTIAFKLAAFLILIAAIISCLNVSDILSSDKTKIIGVCSFVLASILLYSSYYSVSETMEYQENYKNCKELSRRNLSDLRIAQKAYFERYKTFAGDWESIIKFIETDSVNTLVSEGSVPARKITDAERNYIYKDNRPIDNNMNEIEAYKLSKSRICPSDLIDFKRDTVKVSFIKTTFTENRSYLKERTDSKLADFNASSLRYIPFTNNKKQWKLKISKVLIGLDSVCTIRVEGSIPFTKIKDQKSNELMYFGKLELNDLSSSWEEE